MAIVHNASHVLSMYRRYYRRQCLQHHEVENYDCDAEPTCENCKLRPCRLPPSSHHNILYHRALPSTAPQNLVSDRIIKHHLTTPYITQHQPSPLHIIQFHSISAHITGQHPASFATPYTAPRDQPTQRIAINYPAPARTTAHDAAPCQTMLYHSVQLFSYYI